MRFTSNLLEIEVSSRKETAVIKLHGVLNTSTREELIRHLEPIRQDPSVREVILNMDGLTHIDSRGLSTLLSFYRQFTEREVGFRLVNVHDYVLKLLQVSNLVNLFEIGPPPENEAVRVQSRREALWQSHAFTTQLIAALGEAVLGLDSDDKILFANPAAERLLGWDEAELLGRTLKETILPGNVPWPPTQGDFEEGPGAPPGDSPVLRCETTAANREGETLEVELVATTIFQSGERIGKVLGIRDLSQRRQAREELRRLATAVDQSAEMILITDPEGVIQYVNPSFERITGYTREEAVGHPVSILKSGVHDAAFFNDLWTTVLAGRVWKGRFTNKRKDGRFYEEEATISPVHDAMGSIINFVAVKRDITEQVMLEQQLRESQKVEAIAQLAGGIAHDFNNLLTTVIGNIQLARTRHGVDIQGYLQRAEQACLRGASLVQQLLLYSRKSASEKEQVNL
ncbi:MAG: anti-sigma factor antagonist, partial [Candidatus Omnitrophica bacterium]|nr:anti-sigma factor antagonist [Candidatus Omnitrophota bacterium]